MNQMPWIVLIAALSLGGCGTWRTLSNEAGAVDDLAQWHSDCDRLPRAYSGVLYQFCTLKGPVRAGEHWSAESVVTDMVLSGIADTMVLPYRGYRQYRYGSVPVRRLQY